MKTYLLTDKVQIIGRAGEQGGITIAVDVSAWQEAYPDAVGGIMVTRPGGDRMPLVTSISGGLMLAVLPPECTDRPGRYDYTATWTIAGTIEASQTYQALILSSEIERGVPPERWHGRTPDWAKEIYIKAEQILNSVDAALQAEQSVLDARDDAQAAQAAAETAHGAAEDAKDDAEAAKTASEEALASITQILDESQETIAAMQSAADGIEAQKDTMIASIASVAGQGTDTTLTQSGVAADAKVVGDELGDLKSALENQIITFFPTEMQNDICEYTDIQGITTQDGKRIGYTGNQATIIDGAGYTVWTIPVEQNSRIRFKGTYFGADDGGYRSFFVANDGTTIVKAVNNTGADSSQNWIYLDVPYGASNYLAASSTSIKNLAVIQVFTYNSAASKEYVDSAINNAGIGTAKQNISKIIDDIGEKYFSQTPYLPYQSGVFSVDNNGDILLTYKGVRTADFTPQTDQKCRISFSWSTTASSVDIRSYIFGVNGYVVDSDIHTTNAGRKTYTFDPNEAFVYHGASTFYLIVLNNMTDETVEISNLVICQNSMIGQPNDGGSVWDTLSKIDEDVSQNKSDISNISNAEISVINPTGVKYYLNIDGNGDIKPVRAVPLKALFIGNSLLFGNGNSGTVPGVSSDDNFFGMCASNNQLDYFHYITTYLSGINSGFTPSKLYFSPFEHATSAAEVSDYITNKLIPKLSSDLDLVSIQGGDNVKAANEPYFYDGMETLIQTIRTNCPNARISWMAEWFLGANMDTVASICEKYGVKLILIHDLNVTANRGYIGQVITNPNGSTTTVTNAAVAAHPGDTGMRLIANRYLYQMGIAPTDNTYPGA